MLPLRQIIFTVVEDALLGSGPESWTAATDALVELRHRGVPLVLATRGTRAQLDPFRREIEHAHPFLTESGCGLFIPDGYFDLRLEGAERVGRNFRVPFARPYAEAAAALEKIAAQAGASVVGYAQMSAREIARNTGESLHEAEISRQREFSERFFFAGETDKASLRFSEIARQTGWEPIPGDPFWELRSMPADAGASAARYLMRLYRKSLRLRLRSVGIGSATEDLPLLSAMDSAIVLPRRAGECDAVLTVGLPEATLGETAGPAGWNQAVQDVFRTT
jgi:mannosyl-3-phosphoglycerate phosphatase